MAERPYKVRFGSSNEAGFAALLDDVPIEDMTRWVGAGAVHPPIPPTPEQLPYEVRVPGIRLVTPIVPHSTHELRTIVGVAGGAGTIDYAGARVAAPRDSWVYVRSNRTGQGLLRKVVSDLGEVAATWLFNRAALLGGVTSAPAHRLVLAEREQPVPELGNWIGCRSTLLGGRGVGSLADILMPNAAGSWGTLAFLLDSSTIEAVDAAATRITRTPTSAPFTAAVADKHVVLFFDNTVRKVAAWSEDSITLDRPINLRTWAATTAYAFNQGVVHNGVVYVCQIANEGVLGVNDPSNVSYWRAMPDRATGFCILTGADSCNTIEQLADPTKVVLQDLTFYIDPNAPVFLTGRERYNGDATPFQSPLIAYAAGPTINATVENGWLIRSELQQPLVVVQYGISASMISPFLQGAFYSPEQIAPFAGLIGAAHDWRSLDFHPSSPSALFTALTNEITAAKLLIAAEGNTPKCVGIDLNLFDNDPIDEQRAHLVAENAEVLLLALWERIGERVPTVLVGPGRYGGVFQQLVYDLLFGLAARYVNIGVADMREGGPAGTVFPQDWAPDMLHFSATGQIKKARAEFTVWKAVVARIAAEAAPAPVDTSPEGMLARLDAAIAKAITDSLPLVSFPGNGGQIELLPLDKAMSVRKELAVLVNRRTGVRRTLARFN